MIWARSLYKNNLVEVIFTSLLYWASYPSQKIFCDKKEKFLWDQVKFYLVASSWSDVNSLGSLRGHMRQGLCHRLTRAGFPKISFYFLPDNLSAGAVIVICVDGFLLSSWPYLSNSSRHTILTICQIVTASIHNIHSIQVCNMALFNYSPMFFIWDIRVVYLGHPVFWNQLM